MKSNPARLPFDFFHAGWTRLAIGLQRVFCLADPKPERVRALNFFRNGARLRAMRWEERQEYSVYVINREKDVDRLGRFQKSCAKWGVEFERVEAINCADPEFNFAPYDSQIAETFYGKTDFLRGAVGCFLSHAKAWELFINSGKPFALICEDDARFISSLPPRMMDFGFPANFDLAFCNQRMGSGSLDSPITILDNGFAFESAFVAAQKIISDGRKMNSVGTDGYFVSREGARKLLEIFSRRKISMEVDWFIFFHSLSLEERRLFIELDDSGRFEMLEFESLKISGFVMTPSLVEQSTESSTIGFDNQKNYISREAMRAGVSADGG